VTPEQINAIGESLNSLRSENERGVLIAFEALGPAPDVRSGSIRVTVEGGGESATGHALNLSNAINIARAKLADAIKAAAKKREKESEK